MPKLLKNTITRLLDVRSPDEFQEIPLGRVLKHIKRGKYAEPIEDARLALENKDEESYKRLKGNLAAYAFHGRFEGKVVNSEFVESSGLILIDIDNLNSKELATTRDKLENAPHIVFTFDSPSGKGLKASFYVDSSFITDDKSFKQAFSQILNYCASKGITIDPSGKDVRRLCYVSYDPFLYYNKEPILFPLEISSAKVEVSSHEAFSDDDNLAPLPDITIDNAALYLPPPEDVTTYDNWFRVLAGLHHQFKGSEEGLKIADKWSRNVREYKGFDDVAKTWTNIGKRTSGPVITFRSILNDYNKRLPSQSKMGELCEDNQWQTELDQLVETFNLTHAQVFMGCKHYIMRVVPKGIGPHDRESFEFIKRSDLGHMYANTLIRVDKILPSGKLKIVYLSHIEAWLTHPNCRKYPGGMIFQPNGKERDGYLNTWQGYSVLPKENKALCKPILKHIKIVICGGNKELYIYFLNWLAFTFQYPEKPAGTALVLRGEKGCGKGIIGHFLLSLWGIHGLYRAIVKSGVWPNQAASCF